MYTFLQPGNWHLCILRFVSGGLCSWLLAWCLFVTVDATAVAPVCVCCAFVTAWKPLVATEINLKHTNHEVHLTYFFNNFILLVNKIVSLIYVNVFIYSIPIIILDNLRIIIDRDPYCFGRWIQWVVNELTTGITDEISIWWWKSYLATPCALLAVTLTMALLPPVPWRFKLCTSSIELPLDEWLELECPWPDSGLDGGVKIWPSPSHPLSSSSSSIS